MDQKNNHNFTSEQASISQQLHLTDYLNIIRRRKWVVIFFSLVVVSMVTVKSFTTIPIYKATTQIIIEGRPTYDTGMESVMPISSRGQYLETQYDLLKSRGLVLKVIEDLELWKAFASERKMEKAYNLTNFISKVYTAGLSILGLENLLASKTESEPPAESEPLNDQVKPDDMNPIVAWYLKNLKILPVKKSRLVNISFTGISPEMTARIANTHTPAFIDRNFQIQHSTSNQALKWIEEQLKEQKTKLEASQRAVYGYTKRENIISLGGRQNIVSQKLMQLNTTLSRAKTERIAKQIVNTQLKKFSLDNEKIFSLPEIAQNSIIRDILKELVEFKAELTVNKYKPNHPMFTELNLEIKKLEEEITSEVQRLRSTVKIELDRAAAYEKSIQKAVNDQKQVALSLSEKGIRYSELLREAESNQRVYETLLAQSKEIGLTSVLESSNIRIVDEAEVPRFPFKPRIFNNILLSIVLSIFMGTGFAFFFEYMDNTVKTPEDISQHLGMSVIGMVPYDKSLKTNKARALPYLESNSKQKKYAGGYGYLPYESTNYFFTSLQLMQQRKPGHVLLIESATSGEGKTTILAKSAIDLAKGGLRVVMVDADLQRPALHQVFGFERKRSGLLTAMASVLSHKIRKGNLNNYSVDDLFSLIALKRQSGQLFINSNSYNMNVVFENGHLLHIQDKNEPLANRLGTMLLRGGFINENQLQNALERNKRTGQPLGHILTNSGYLVQDQLQGALKLQMEENLQKVFSWKHGTFVFTPGSVEAFKDERIYFGEDYTPIIRRLGRMAGSRLLESVLLQHVNTVIKRNLSILPVGIAPTIPDTVYYTLLEKFLYILKQRFDVVLVDVPPVIDAGGATPLAAMADGVLIVIKAGYLSVKTINEATTSLKKANAKIIGAILNQVKIGRGNYYKY